MDDYSLSSISNNGSFLSFPMINKKQILLDWVNTINEPQCLLVSEMGHLKDGRVFVEILKHFLQRESMLTSFIRDINASDRMSPIQRVLMVIEVMSKVDNNKMVKKKFEKFHNNHLRLFKDEECLLDFIALLRIIFEKEIVNDYEEEQPKALIRKNEEGFIVQSGSFRSGEGNGNDFYSYQQLQKPKKKVTVNEKQCYREDNAVSNEELAMNRELQQVNNEEMPNEGNQVEQIEDDNEVYDNFNSKAGRENTIKKEFVRMNNNHFYNPMNYKKNNERNESNTSSYYNNNAHKNNYHTIDNKLYQQDPFNVNNLHFTQNQLNTHFNTAFTPQVTLPQMEIAKNDQFDIHPQQQPKQKSQSKPNQPRPITPVKKHSPAYGPTTNLNDFDLSIISKKHSQSGLSDISFSTQTDPYKLYTKKRKAEISMSRGILLQSKLFKLETNKGIAFAYSKIVLPTQPITIVSYDQIIKHQITVSNCNAPSRNHLVSQQRDNRGECIPKPKPQENSHSCLPQAILSYKSSREKKPESVSNISIAPINQTVFNQNEFSLRRNLNDKAVTSNKIEPQMEMYSNDNTASKNKIYSWLVDIGILKDKAIELNDIPNICINGVLLCDLVNRCEGRNECIHGIIRKTTTKSQIQVNVNKVLVHLRSIEKFSSRHLWSHSEIVQGNAQVIWELLEDLYNFYSIKTKFIPKSKSKPKVGSIPQSNDQSCLEKEPLMNIDSNEGIPLEINPLPTPLHNRPSSSFKNERSLLSQPVIFTEPKPKEIIRIQSYSQLTKMAKPSQMVRCNTNNNLKPNTKHNISINNSNQKPNNNVSLIQKQNQSFQSQIASNNISGFLLFEKSAVKRLKQNIDQISGLTTTNY